jgi:hypothetical protein
MIRHFDPPHLPQRSAILRMATPDGLVRFVDDYFIGRWGRSDSRTGSPGKVDASHRTLSSYVNALIDAGLMLERMGEVQATGALAEKWPGWAAAPAVLVARCRK